MSGWTWLPGGRKWHYFPALLEYSLCGNWMDLRPEKARELHERGEHPDNCVTCWKKLQLKGQR